MSITPVPTFLIQPESWALASISAVLAGFLLGRGPSSTAAFMKSWLMRLWRAVLKRLGRG